MAGRGRALKPTWLYVWRVEFVLMDAKTGKWATQPEVFPVITADSDGQRAIELAREYWLAMDEGQRYSGFRLLTLERVIRGALLGVDATGAVPPREG